MLTGDSLPKHDEYGKVEFPSHLIDPAKKDKKWALQYFKAAYYQHKNNQGFFSNEKKADWMEARKYAQGTQSVTKYHKWASRLTDQSGNTVSYLDLNWKIVSPVPKFCDVLKGYFSKLKYDITCNAINPEASLEREQAKASMWAVKMLQPFFAELEQAAGQSFGENPDVPFVPETKEELELFFNLSFRLKTEIAMERGQKMVFNENAWDEMADLIWDDVIQIGALGAAAYVDPISKRIKLRYCDPVNMLLDSFRGKNGDKMERIGEFQLKTLAQIKLEAGDQFTDEEYYEIAKNNCGRYGNAEKLSPYADYVNTDAINNFYPYDNMQILVLELYLDSCDTIKHEKKTVKGVKYMFKKPYNEKVGKKTKTDAEGNIYEREVIATDVKTVYGGTWVVGTDYIYNWGKCKDISRPKDNPKETMKPMKFYRISEQSSVERMLPFADSIQMTWLKMQNLKARAIPKGLMIEMGAFENLMLDGSALSSREALEIAIQSGIILYRRNSTHDDDGYDNTGPPIAETKGGLGAEFQELKQTLFEDIMMCREVSGISELFDASQQNPKQLVGTANLAIAGTQNAITSMINGFVWMHERLAIEICLKLQLLARYGNIQGYAPALGRNVLEIINIGKEITTVMYGIVLEAQPNEDQKLRIMQAAQLALESVNDPNKGGIDFADYLRIGKFVDEGNLKMAEAYLGYKTRMFQRQQQQIVERNIQLQGEQNKELAAVTEKSKQDTITLDTQSKIAVDNNKAANDLNYLKTEYQLKSGLSVQESQQEEQLMRKTEPVV